MTTLYPVQDTFVRGEISPRIHARASLDLYRAALSKCENFVTLPHGGSQLRQNNLTTQAAISRFSGRQAAAASISRAGGNLVSGLSGIYDPSKAVTFGKSAFPPAPGGGLY